MLVNVTNEQGRVNAALRGYDERGCMTYEFTPVVGAVIETDSGGCWQLREDSQRAKDTNDSRWVDLCGAGVAESYFGHYYDGSVIQQTGRTIQRNNKVGEGVRVRITFVGDGEEDQVVGGWLKVGNSF